MKTYFAENDIKYTGEQLRSLWIYKTFDLQGDAMVAFIGPCEVNLNEMVDQADVLAGDSIYSERMISFILEHFELDLEKMVIRQRLLSALARDLMAEMAGDRGVSIRRDGDDLMDGSNKISVSIATLSRVSSLIHFGINISSQNTPLPTKGLDDYGIDPKQFGTELLRRYSEEFESMRLARCKVRGVD